jgi:membrane protein required for colicin V production
MNWIDAAVIAVIFLSALVGLARGLIREVMSLAVWLAAVGVGYLYYKGIAEVLTPHIAQPGVRLGVAFVGLVLIVLILGAVLGALLSKLIDKTGLTGLDRLLGLFFGAARGIVLVAMAVFLAGLTPLADESWWQESKAIAQCQQAAVWLLSLVPPAIQDQLKKV